MNGLIDLVADTCAVIGWLKRPGSMAYFMDRHPGCVLHVSVLTRIELLAYGELDSVEEAAIGRFLGDADVVSLNAEVERLAIALRRATRRKLPDAIVAATAVWLDAPLVTADRRLAETAFRGLRTVLLEEPPADPA